MTTGIIKINYDQYSLSPGVRKSDLDLIARSPAHYYEGRLSPERDAEESTEAFDMGRAIHSAVLEPDLFGVNYIRAPNVNRRTNAGKQTLEDLANNNPGKVIMRDTAFDACCRVRDAAYKHVAVQEILRDGEAEMSAYAERGVALLKARPDYSRTGMLIDLKSTIDARPDAFSRDLFKYRYHVQAAYYSDVWEEAGGGKVHAFMFICIEKEAPYSIAVYEIDRTSVMIGRSEYMRNLDTYIACEKEGFWPSYAEEITPIGIPAWAVKQFVNNQEL